MRHEIRTGLSKLEEQNLVFKDSQQRMQTQLEMWDGKIRRMDQKMKTLDETASMLAATASEQKKDFTNITMELK